MNTEIKQCPFCSGAAELRTEHSCIDTQMADDIDTAFCVCTNCGARGSVELVRNARYRKTCKKELNEINAKAIEKWNRRI